MSDLPAEFEQQLASMTDGEFSALTAKVRAPDTAEAFREAASKFIDGARLETICKVANLAAFTNEHGEIDEAKVGERLRAVFGLPAPPRWANHGQFTQTPHEPAPGDRGNAEVRKRFGDGGPLRASAGAAEAAKRFGKRKA
jgi:hypothetical protein